jgi:hypothetical protein
VLRNGETTEPCHGHNAIKVRKWDNTKVKLFLENVSGKKVNVLLNSLENVVYESCDIDIVNKAANDICKADFTVWL